MAITTGDSQGLLKRKYAGDRMLTREFDQKPIKTGRGSGWIEAFASKPRAKVVRQMLKRRRE